MQKPINLSVFRFQQFDIQQAENPLKVGTDSMVFGSFIPVNGKSRALDIGSGTGVLSLMALQENQTLQIDAIEIHDAAAQECAFNVQNSPWPSAVTVHLLDFFSFESSEPYDLIFSNPPFYIDGLKSGVEELNQAKHMDRSDFELLIRKASSLLSDSGLFSCILPGDQREFTIALAAESGLVPVRIISIHANEQKLNKRVIIDFSKIPTTLIFQELFIRNLDGTYHSSYIEQTKKFHRTDLSKKF